MILRNKLKKGKKKMKCPERFTIVQQNYREPVFDDEDKFKGEYSAFFEKQMFPECFKENCAAWDVEKQKCRKF